MQWICGCNLLLHKIESYQLSHQKTNGTLSNAVCKYTLSAQRNGPRNSPQSPIRLASGYTCIFSTSKDSLNQLWCFTDAMVLLSSKTYNNAQNMVPKMIPCLIYPHSLILHLSEISQSSSLTGLTNYIAGKWHAGFHTAAHLPTNRGFDTFRGFLTSGPSNYMDRGR